VRRRVGGMMGTLFDGFGLLRFALGLCRVDCSFFWHLEQGEGERWRLGFLRFAGESSG
jgi:hypothetical protein